MGEDDRLEAIVHWQVYMCVIDGDCNCDCAIVSRGGIWEWLGRNWGHYIYNWGYPWVYIGPLVLVTPKDHDDSDYGFRNTLCQGDNWEIWLLHTQRSRGARLVVIYTKESWEAQCVWFRHRCWRHMAMWWISRKVQGVLVSTSMSLSSTRIWTSKNQQQVTSTRLEQGHW